MTCQSDETETKFLCCILPFLGKRRKKKIADIPMCSQDHMQFSSKRDSFNLLKYMFIIAQLYSDQH